MPVAIYLINNNVEIYKENNMNKFITTRKILSELEEIITGAKKELILVSPYIKLDKNTLNFLNRIKEKPHLKITIVFGKNKNDLKKSLNLDDLNFFSKFS